MEQQNKQPRKRTAREAGLAPERSNSRGLIAVVIVLLLAIGGVTAAMMITQGTDKHEDEQIVAPETPSDEQGVKDDASKKADADKTPAASDSSDATTGDENDQDTSASQDGDNDASSSSSEATGSDSDSSDGSSSADDSSSSSSGYDSSGGSGSSDGSGSSGGSSSGSSSTSSSSAGKSDLKDYFDLLSAQSKRLKSFVDETYNPHLYKSLSTRKSDYQQFKGLRDDILANLRNADGWEVSSISVGSSLTSTKKDLESASNVLKKRLEIIEAGYKAITGLPANASKAKIDEVNNAACKDSGPQYSKFNSMMSKIDKKL